MAKTKQVITKLDVKNLHPFRTQAEVLNKVFQKKTNGGRPYELFLRGGIRITQQKCCTFIHLAERTPEGGWLPPKTPRDWLNIPAPKDAVFTQIQLNKQDDSYFKAITGIEE